MLSPPDATKDIIEAVNLLESDVVAAINAIVVGTPPDASETVKGILELATQAEVTTGTDDTRAITPLKLAVAVPAASETETGKIEIATQTEVNTGTDNVRAVTPLKLANTSLVLCPDASETVKGKIEIATQAEVTTGTDDLRAITPLKLDVAVPAASETASGKIEIATQAEVTTGTDDLRAITPLKFKNAVKGYSISGDVTSFAPAYGAIYAIGHIVIGIAFGTIQRRYIPQPGRITAVYLHWSATTTGTGENIVCAIRLNNTTDTAVATVGSTAAQKLFSNTGLNIAVVAGNYVELKLTCPPWVTNPLGVTLTFEIYIET